MRCLLVLAAFALLFAAAWSWGGHDGTLVLQTVRHQEPVTLGSLFHLRACEEAVVDGDISRLLRMSVDRRDVRVAGEEVVVEEDRGSDSQGLRRESLRSGTPPGNVGQVVDDNPYLEPALAYYGVEWAREALIIVRFKESSNQIVPCKVGDRLERGPYQFMAGTWAGTPYAALDPCDLEAATWATSWKVSQPEGWRAWRSTWPR